MYYNVGKNTAKIPIVINNPQLYPIKTLGYTVENCATGAVIAEDYTYNGSPLKSSVKSFDIENLDPDTEYIYYFYVEFEDIGYIGSEEYSFKTEKDPYVQPDDEITGVKINDVELKYKNTTTIKPEVTGANIKDCEVKFESSNPKVATVDKNGNITTMTKGETIITCTVTDRYGNTLKDTCKVTVKFSFGQWLIWILLFGFLWY